MVTFEEVLENIYSKSTKADQGRAFERATVYYLKNDPLYQQQFSDVWLWEDSPTNTGQDIGIDIVARDAHDQTYWAIQCKCFQEDATLSYKEISTFFATAAAEKRTTGEYIYQHYMIVDTVNAWSKNLQKVAEKYDTVRVSADNLRDADLDWTPFLQGRDQSERTFMEPRPHQQEAIERSIEGFKTADRGKLIMACGTGKTLTALRLAEEMCPTGTVLFLAPSITLVSQTLRAWANQAKGRLRPFVVCSDAKASKVADIWSTSVFDIPYPATTDPKRLAREVTESVKDGEFTVIFSTYQSIQVVIDAQKEGVPEFDLCICDEAHRTTGVDSTDVSKEERSAFTKVHDAQMLKAKKRLYMTATPRVYSTKAKKLAHVESYEISSMDDVSKYGEEFYRLSFGQAVEKGLLSDYRVIVLTVSETMASQIYQQTMSEEEGEFKVPDVAKILGCWKGLATRGAKSELNIIKEGALEEDHRYMDAEATLPMQRAVAFTSSIKESKKLADTFQEVVDAYIETSGTDNALQVEALHVDGTMDSTTRKSRLRWLEENPGDDICRVLTNAKCLSEGVDVPDLDAVLFMKERKSQVEIIQAVGRVMRKAPNKQYGYIILPVVVPAGMTPEQALDDDKAFAVVWQILQALRSHDERLDARINSLKFEGAGEDRHIQVVPFDEGESTDSASEQNVQEKLELAWTAQEWQDAMEATLVKKCGTRVYWEDWADDVAGIAQRHIARINKIIERDKDAQEAFDKFLTGLRDSLNPGITQDQAIEMLAQHLITLPVFEALFGDASFAKSNPVSIAMEEMLATLNKHSIENREDDAVLQDLYDSVRSRVSVVETDAGRQGIIKELYEGFFSKAFKSDADKMGIVYTPGEVVDYILRSTDRMLKQEFGEGLGSRGVHILDPFAGTGTFMAQLITSDIISDEELPYKYAHEFHSNEIMLLAYYIMVVNIEQAYHARISGEYVPFEGAVLTDTFQMTEANDSLDVEVFVDNSERVLEQNELDIRVIVGNPPYSVGQRNENDNNANQSYPSLDKKIRDTYVARSDASLSKGVYDSYVRAIKWASERIGNAGIVCFVTNAGWLEASATDGMRRCLTEEFNSIYVFHLRGNQRTQGEESKKEGGKIFGSGSRAPIAISMFIKTPSSIDKGNIYFHDIGDYLTREKKLEIVANAAVNGIDDWVEIRPDRHGDWIHQRDDSWYEFAPSVIDKCVEKKASAFGIFELFSYGVVTNRDAWAYNFSLCSLQANMTRLLDTFHSEQQKAKESGLTTKDENQLDNDGTKIKWTRRLKDYCLNGRILEVEPCWTVSMYRPFCKQWLYFNQELNEMTCQQTRLFPLVADERPKGPTSKPISSSTPKTFSLSGSNGKGGEMTCQQTILSSLPNVVIQVAGVGSRSFSCLMSNCVPCLDSVEKGQCFPLYWYEDTSPTQTRKSESQDSLFDSGDDALVQLGSGFTQHEAITDDALNVFREVYPEAFPQRPKKNGGLELTKEDIFYYVYGILHSPEYRERFAANLKKELPRVPLAEDFVSFSNAGRELAELHLNYETIEPYPLEEVGNSSNPGRTEKMYFGKCEKDEEHPKGEDKTVLYVAENLRLEGIPLQTYDYVVNGKSAVGWLMDRYRVTTDKASGIVNDPNEYSNDPRYIVDLVKRVVRVSLETLEIVGNLPPLNEKPQPADWPIAWKTDC